MIPEKQPIEIIPERIWKQQRAEDLSAAIARYVGAKQYKNADKTIVAWLHELEKLTKELESFL